MSMILLLAALQSETSFESGRVLPLASGQWSYAADSGGSSARYGNLFELRCDRRLRRVLIRRPDIAASPQAKMIIATDTATRSVPALNAWLGTLDPILEAIAYSRGRFVIEVEGGAPLAIPNEPELARSIEDCRN